MATRKLWSKHDDDYDTTSSSTDSRLIILYVLAGVIGLVCVVSLLYCWRQHRNAKRAKLARQDAVLNMPMAIPWETSAVPYAEVVDIAATAPDHDELLPATAPEDYVLQR